tara:strand:+ start:5757 stop:6428 length:672 start_codon:yes stop_codon:yes gene_type:complete
MYWQDEGYLLSKNNYDENSIIIEVFTLEHGKYSGIVYGGNSKKNKKNFQIGNKMLLNWKSKGENRMGYFNVELIKAISPMFFNDKIKSISLLSASTILKILLPERQVNEIIYKSFEDLIERIYLENWIKYYIFWELSLFKDLGFEVRIPRNDNLNTETNINITINDKIFKIPKFILKKNGENAANQEIKEALAFNKNLLIENFIYPNKLKFPISRNILEKYYN